VTYYDPFHDSKKIVTHKYVKYNYRVIIVTIIKSLRIILSN